jgi:hypothetical protein
MPALSSVLSGEPVPHRDRESKRQRAGAIVFCDGGVVVLRKDAPRPGRPCTVPADTVKQIVDKTTQEKPVAATHWSTRTMAAATGVSEATVRRIWHAHGFKSHLVRTFKVSNDPQFAEKLETIVGSTSIPKVLAALNHPNIAIIHGLEDRAIVMELVEGPTLADLLKAGAIPLEESLKIAAQIADALEAAHEKGVVHRDLKPANVKALDFGLATAVVSSTREAGDANSPTLTMGATEVNRSAGELAKCHPKPGRKASGSEE